MSSESWFGTLRIFELNNAGMLNVEQPLSANAIAALQAEMKQRQDFLRPGIVVFVPGAGEYPMTIGYKQEPWMYFQPPAALHLEAAPVTLIVK